MFEALKPGFRSLAALKLVVMLSANFKPKETAVASRGFLATARLSCFHSYHAVIFAAYSGEGVVVLGVRVYSVRPAASARRNAELPLRAPMPF